MDSFQTVSDETNGGMHNMCSDVWPVGETERFSE